MPNQSQRTQPGGMPRLPERQLKSYHIFMIGISGTIGVGFFASSGEILGIAGPGGVLLAFGVVGFVACMVMEGICEMLVNWAVPNPMVEFVKIFVDRDLAIVVGFAYWYTYAITFPALIITTGTIVNFWDLSIAWKCALFVLLPLAIVLINSRSVLFFGNIELAGGAIKLLLVFSLFILMIFLDQGVGPGERIGATFFNDGIRNNPNVADSRLKAALIGISLAVFPYVGIESITVTAFEAKDPQKSLRFAAKNLAYFVTILYFFSVLAFSLNVEWFNQSLETYFGQPSVTVDAGDMGSLGHHPSVFYGNDTNSESLPVIAILQAGIKVLPGFVTACLAYSALSCANSGLYIASRTMYGLAQSLDPDSTLPIIRLLSRLGTVTPDTKVPGWALLLSCIFLWLPFLHMEGGYARGELQQILIRIGSTSCVLVWASQCLAFIRYHKWRKMHKDNLLEEQYLKYHPTEYQGFSSWFKFLQPLPAWIGLIGCITIVLVFASVGMWNGEKLAIKALTIYLGPVLLLLIFIILKIINRRKWVVLGDWPELRSVLIGLEGRQVQPSKFGNQEGDAVSDDGGSGNFSATGEDMAEVAHQFERFSQEVDRSGTVSPEPIEPPDQVYRVGKMGSVSNSSGSGSSSFRNKQALWSQESFGVAYASDASTQYLRPNNMAELYSPDSADMVVGSPNMAELYSPDSSDMGTERPHYSRYVSRYVELTG